jgi:signal peptidase I
MATLRPIARGMATLFTGVAVLAAVAVGVLGWAGYRPEPVLSGSMEPFMPTGSLIVVKRVPASTVKVGDVITFQRPGSNDMLTHRVVKIERHDGRPVYTTKGDANEAADPFPLRLPGEVGAHVTTVPELGRVALAINQHEVRGGLIAIFTLLLLLATLRAIWRTEEKTPQCAELLPL